MIIQRSIKKALQNPEAVTGLDLRQVKPDILFPEIEKFVNLEYIDLSNCTNLNWVDACIKLSKLPRLAELKAFGAEVLSLPAELGLLVSLKKIDFSNNARLTEIPESFSSLMALEEISFFGCGLERLPEAPWHFSNLQTLTMSRNKLAAIPANFFEAMPKLAALFISDNQLSTLPEGLTSLLSLQTLYTGNNPLTELPKNLSALINLQTVWLDNCPGINFEQELEKLKSLRIKNLTILGNNLSKLPHAIKEFSSLEVLNINSNKITDTRKLIEELSQLPIAILDIRFMGTENISLEDARQSIPTLNEVSCDTRNTEQFTNDISAWVSTQLIV